MICHAVRTTDPCDHSRKARMHLQVALEEGLGTRGWKEGTQFA
jgi:hypothetical protein